MKFLNLRYHKFIRLSLFISIAIFAVPSDSDSFARLDLIGALLFCVTMPIFFNKQQLRPYYKTLLATATILLFLLLYHAPSSTVLMKFLVYFFFLASAILFFVNFGESKLLEVCSSVFLALNTLYHLIEAVIFESHRTTGFFQEPAHNAIMFFYVFFITCLHNKTSWLSVLFKIANMALICSLTNSLSTLVIFLSTSISYLYLFAPKDNKKYRIMIIFLIASIALAISPQFKNNFHQIPVSAEEKLQSNSDVIVVERTSKTRIEDIFENNDGSVKDRIFGSLYVARAAAQQYKIFGVSLDERREFVSKNVVGPMTKREVEVELNVHFFHVNYILTIGVFWLFFLMLTGFHCIKSKNKFFSFANFVLLGLSYGGALSPSILFLVGGLIYVAYRQEMTKDLKNSISVLAS